MTDRRVICTSKNMRTNTNPHIITAYLKRNKFFPNSKLPVLIYRKVFDIPKQKNKASGIIQAIFLRNSWRNTWRNGIYDFHHYHSNAHECLGVAAGEAVVILGGPNGRRIKIKQGDLVILPGGTGHKCVVAADDFICIGAYPQSKDFDINHGTKSGFRPPLARLKKLPVPKKDPVFGAEGFLKSCWK